MIIWVQLLPRFTFYFAIVVADIIHVINDDDDNEDDDEELSLQSITQ